MFTISTHDNNIKTCRSGHHLLLRLPESVFVFFAFFLSFLRRSFSCSIGQLIFVVFLLFFISFFFFGGGGGQPGTFFRCNAFNAFSSITFFFGGEGGKSGTFF